MASSWPQVRLVDVSRPSIPARLFVSSTLHVPLSMLTGSADGTVRIWDAHGSTEQSSYEGVAQVV